MEQEVKEIFLPDIVGKGYGSFWRAENRYRVVKGSRASKKSTTTALNIICRMMDERYSKANTLVIRQTYSSLKDSCFAQLRWAISYLNVDAFWKIKHSPLEMIYIPTGQRIIFRGLDKVLKITSITVPKGVLCWGWVEEAYEIDEEAFNRIDESLRGEMPKGYFVQWTLTFNPWTECWLKSRFFDAPSDNIFSMTATYHCNEWLSKADFDLFEEIKKYDPERYKVVGCGEWGLVGGAFFDCWRESLHVVKPFHIPDGWIKFRAADWGSYHPYCVLWFAIDYDGNLWCYRELYGYGGKANVGTRETAKQLGEKIVKIEKETRERINYAVLDSACWASPGTTGPSIAEEINGVLTANNLISFGKSSKGRAEGANQIKQRLIGTVINGEQKAALRFFNTCIHTIRTLPSLGFDKYNPDTYDTQGEDHATDAVAYGCLSRPYAPQITETKRTDGYSLKRDHASVWTI